MLSAAMSLLMSFTILGPSFFGSFLLEPKKALQGCGSQSFPPDRYRHKKARRACAVRALRTSSDDSGNHRWRILGLASLCFELYLVDIKYFNLNLFRIGFQKGTLKYNHSTLNGSSTPSEFKITCQCSHVCYELGADTGFTVSAKLNWQISIRHQTR